MKVRSCLEHKVHPNWRTKHLHIALLQMLVIWMERTLALLHRGVYDPGLANKATDTLMKANTSFPVEMTLCTLMEAWSCWRSIWKRPDLTLKGHQLIFTENLLCARGSSHNIPFNPHQKVVSTISPLY